ncbi:MAG: hypothetical protein QM764_23735 [Chitinophagaceae bacterium]
MLGLNIWDILAFIGFIFLVAFFYAGKNLVWGAFSFGIILALIVCGIYFLKNDAWPWDLFKKIIVTVTLGGVLVEVAIRIGGRLRKKL